MPHGRRSLQPIARSVTLDMRAFVTCAVVISLAAGCGDGGDDDGESPSGFAGEANAICAERQRALADWSPDDRSRDRFEPVVEAFAEEHQALEDLDPPSDVEDEYREMVGHFGEQSRHHSRVLELERRIYDQPGPQRDRSLDVQWRAANEDALAAGGRGRKIARDLGLETCGDAVY
jgi:hypothetical protein